MCMLCKTFHFCRNTCPKNNIQGSKTAGISPVITGWLHSVNRVIVFCLTVTLLNHLVQIVENSCIGLMHQQQR